MHPAHPISGDEAARLLLSAHKEATSETIRGAALLIVWHAAAIASKQQPGQVQLPVEENIQVPGNTCEPFFLVIVLGSEHSCILLLATR